MFVSYILVSCHDPASRCRARIASGFTTALDVFVAGPRRGHCRGAWRMDDADAPESLPDHRRGRATIQDALVVCHALCAYHRSKDDRGHDQFRKTPGNIGPALSDGPEGL